MKHDDSDLFAGFVVILFRAPVYILVLWALMKYVGCVS